MPILPKLAIRELDPYTRVAEGRMEFVRLDLNENTLGLPTDIDFDWTEDSFSIYPEYDALLNRLSNIFEVNTAELLITNGSNEAFNVIASTFVEPGQSVAVISKPCFAMITHSLRVAGALLKEVSVLDNLEFDCRSIEQSLRAGCDIAVFASPDNPTGAMLPQNEIIRWCGEFPHTLFVIDEAYSEYAGESIVPQIAKYGNLLVIKTFSKAWGLAGLRLGMVLGNAKLISFLRRVIVPYSVNVLAAAVAQRLLDNESAVTQSARQVMQRKDSLVRVLEQYGYKIKKGAANFFLVDLGIDAESFCAFLKTHKILVRNRSTGNSLADSPLWGQVRVTVGTEGENRLFLQAVEAFSMMRVTI